MHKRNCSTCKLARHDLIAFNMTRYHCGIYNENIPWYYNQRVSAEQFDLIAMVGCASYQPEEG